MKTTSGWSAKLTRSIVLKDGTRLVTLGDVRAFILKQPEHIQERGSWQHAAELMILAAERAPSDSAVRFHLGMTYAKLGRPQDAVSALRRAAQLDPKLAERENITQAIKDLGG